MIVADELEACTPLVFDDNKEERIMKTVALPHHSNSKHLSGDVRVRTRSEGKLYRFLLVTLSAVALSGFATLAVSGEFGTAEEAKAMLQKVVAAIKANKSDALTKVNSGTDGFKDRDLYPFCVGLEGIITAHPDPKARGSNLKDAEDKNGKMFGEEIMRVAKEGEVAQVDYLYPRPGTKEPVNKVTFVTKVGDQMCGVGYYK